MCNYYIEYKLNKYYLKLKQIDNNLYKIIELTYNNIIITNKIIEILINKSIEILLKRKEQDNLLLSNNNENNNNNLECNLNDIHRSSPVSVIYISEDTNLTQQLYSKKVINILRDLFFKCDESELFEYQNENEQNNNNNNKNLNLQQTPLLISIEGNIGAGKTTLLNKLKETHPEWIFIDEPVDFWTTLMNNNGQSLFELYYHNQHRWAYTFQNCAILSRYHAIESTLKKNSSQFNLLNETISINKRQVYITERCLESDFQIFAKKLYLEGKMDNIEYELYQKWFQQLIGTSNIDLSAVILVDTPPETCYDRIKGRGRDGEEGIPLKYLEELNYYQEEWLSTLSSRSNNKNISCYRTTSIEDIENFVNDILISN